MNEERRIREYMQINKDDELWYYKDWVVVRGASTVSLEIIEQRLVSKKRNTTDCIHLRVYPNDEVAVEGGSEYPWNKVAAPTNEIESVAAMLATAAGVRNWRLQYWTDMANFYAENKPKFQSENGIDVEGFARAFCSREGNNPDTIYEGAPLWTRWKKYAS